MTWDDIEPILGTIVFTAILLIFIPMAFISYNNQKKQKINK